MQKKSFLTFIILLAGFITEAQQIPVGSCGIVNIYDAAGNRTKRVYFCNNGTNPYPARGVNPQPTVVTTDTSSGLEQTTEFQYVDALYPNPTTGKFFVTFSKALHNAAVSVTNLQGKTIFRFKASGNKVDFDLSGVAASVYFIRIEENGKVLTKKVIKQ